MIMNMPNIQGSSLKIKSLVGHALGEWGLLAIVFLVALASFGLGRLSALIDARAPVAITMAPTLTEPRGMYIGGLYVASRGGSAYYYPWCTGAAKILPANRVWFPSESAARAAGYAPAKNCQGLVSQ